MLKLDEQFRDKKILIISFFQQFRFGFWEQKKILVFFGLYLAPRIRICGSAYFCESESGSRTPKWYHRIGLFLWFPFIFQNLKSSVITWKPWNNCRQCLGSVGSGRFWLPGSGSAKICGSSDPDPRGKISTKKLKKIFFYSETPIRNFKKREIIKISSFLNSSSFRIKICENKQTKN